MLEFWVSSLRSNQNNYSLSERTRWSNAALWLAIPCVKVGLSFLWLRALSRKNSIRFKIYRSFSGNYCSSKILSYYIGARTVLGEYLDRRLNLERPWLIPHESKCLEKYHGWGQLKSDIWSLIRPSFVLKTSNVRSQWNLRIARCKISDWITMWIPSSPWLFGSFFETFSLVSLIN